MFETGGPVPNDLIRRRKAGAGHDLARDFTGIGTLALEQRG